MGVYVYPTRLPTLGTEVFSFDCTGDEGRNSPADVTPYAVDTGYQMADGVAVKAETYHLTGVVTATPVGGLLGIKWDKPRGMSRPRGAYEELLRLRNAREPVALALRFASPVCYLGPISYRANKDLGNAIEITIEATEFREATPAFGSIPASKLAAKVQPQATKGATGATGAAKTTPKTKLFNTVNGILGALGAVGISL